MAVAAAVIGAVVAVGTAVYSGVQQNQVRQDQKGAQGKAERAQAAASRQMKDKQLTDQADAEREAIRARTRALRGGGGGRKSTILTSPTGVAGGAPTSGAQGAGKTLIGA